MPSPLFISAPVRLSFAHVQDRCRDLSLDAPILSSSRGEGKLPLFQDTVPRYGCGSKAFSHFCLHIKGPLHILNCNDLVYTQYVDVKAHHTFQTPCFSRPLSRKCRSGISKSTKNRGMISRLDYKHRGDFRHHRCSK